MYLMHDWSSIYIYMAIKFTAYFWGSCYCSVLKYIYIEKNKIFSHTLRLHYNAFLYNADSIITRSPRGSQIFIQYTMCEHVSRQSRYTQCKLWFPSQVWHQLIFPRGGVNGLLNIPCLRNRGSCVVERWSSNFCLQNKTSAASGKHDNDDIQCRRCL